MTKAPVEATRTTSDIAIPASPVAGFLAALDDVVFATVVVVVVPFLSLICLFMFSLLDDS